MPRQLVELEPNYDDDHLDDSDYNETQSFLPNGSRKSNLKVGTAASKTGTRIVRCVVLAVCLIAIGLYTFSKDVGDVADVELKRNSTITSTESISVPTAPPRATAVPTMTPDDLPAATFAPTAPGFGKPPSYYSSSYVRRGRELTAEEQQQVDTQWGKWTFQTRTNPDLPKGYPNQDVPRSAFPPGSWQTDPEYLKGFLEASIEYLDRAREAMLQEYGHSKFDQPDTPFDQRAYMFNLTVLSEPSHSKQPAGTNAGDASYSTLLSLRKRLLHAVMTESEFRFVMGGHSAAAGHGNHFQQSYTLQVQKVMEPILARVGVYFQAHNFGMGGLGTSQNALGAKDLYGRCDVLMWDSGMTEGDGPSKDMFARMGLLSSQPVLWGAPDGGAYDKFGGGFIRTVAKYDHIPKTNLSDLEATPYWARYMACDQEDKSYCGKFKYDTHCWVDREDGYKPKAKQVQSPGGQASWHPGNRHHQLQGRLIAWQLVSQLYEGLKQWYETPNYELEDAAWHITEDKERIKQGVLTVTDSNCYAYNFDIPKRFCHFPLNARSDMSPRRDPEQTSLFTIMKEGVTIPSKKPNEYDPPDSFNPSLFHPGIDIVHILQNGIEFAPNKARVEANQAAARYKVERKPVTSQLEPGKGWGLNAKSNPDVCDGTWDSFCGRSSDNCMLSGHNDHRGGITFDSLSGWMIFDLEKVRHGMIMIRIEYWMGSNNPPTSGWTCENNAETCDDNQRRRSLKKPFQFKCDDFKFEFAIDGKITVWDKAEWEARRMVIQRVVPLWVLLDDEDWTGERDVELAIRQTGCGRDDEFSLSHVYWG